MKVKLSEIFIRKPECHIYTVDELSILRLKNAFIQRLADRFDLSYVEDTDNSNDLCYAENREIRPEYRNTFSRREVLDIVLLQVCNPVVDLEADEVEFPTDARSFFSESFKSLVDIKTRKKYLRRTMLKRRNQLPRKERFELSDEICRQLWSIILARNVRVIHSYLTMGSEVNVLPLLQKAIDCQITVVVPKTLQGRKMQHLILTDLKNMEAGIFNTYHPRSAIEYQGEFDMIIVAGLAFDRRGYRVGYGGGHYDTFLANQGTPMKIGICYPFQLVEEVPKEKHDVQVNQVIC